MLNMGILIRRGRRFKLGPHGRDVGVELSCFETDRRGKERASDKIAGGPLRSKWPFIDLLISQSADYPKQVDSIAYDPLRQIRCCWGRQSF